jgi:CRP/FNR family transcriptional regulator, cyclic AMP receptor protein
MKTSFDSSIESLLGGASFHKALDAPQLERLRADIQANPVTAGSIVARRGAAADAWLGVAKGLVRIENSGADGRQTTLTHFSAGCWFGEGTLLKRGAWPFDAVAVVDSMVACVPISTFEWLLDSSFAFNRFLLNQFNARLAQFVERCEHLRLHDAEHHVVHCLNEMVDPRLCPYTENCITVSQSGLAHLAGVSRSVVNRVLNKLERQGLVRVDYRSITLLDPTELRRFSAASDQ